MNVRKVAPLESSFSKVNLSSIFVGALISLLLNTIVLTTVALIAFAFFGLEAGKLGYLGLGFLGGLLFLGSLAGFGIGGFLAGRTAGAGSPWAASLHGLSSFSIAAVTIASAFVLYGTSFAMDAAQKLGFSAGAAVGANSVVDELSRVQIITDLKIFKGKAVTTLSVPPPGQAIRPMKDMKQAGTATKKLSDDPRLKKDAEDIARETRHILSLTSFGFLAWLLAGSYISAYGGRRGRKAALPDLWQQEALSPAA